MKPRCKVGADHDVLVAEISDEAWAKLRYVGVQDSFETDEQGRPILFEMRDCACGGTLSREIRRG